ncbi:hypothetical protein ACCS70_07380 [Rhizobium ruizarguesonis]|uniref:hypothetical protein n=1 Tax=Rhizobium ruizarguesonis TaxID=2081791 RepID=UPI00102FE235|nr:hypothetical protein [Rhizobium ruizarguesonis]MBY5802223.1 hypothetical protein [Rhizobium leguminosarum]NKL16617.1 hypothetical protein [Rhizobium leguminosarum bv. viciae]MBY5843232.1 hypothetical protein [Rhizobium leguminosarum]MBY5850319.1 hypothetical protein [Rhizobium leguminosarum]MBY5885569.1 hypothetical protein [Rhizobium leguminosarum]
MTDRMPLAELAGPVRIELCNIFMYQGVNVSCSGVELHRQLFHARPAQDHRAIGRNNITSVPAGCRIVENRGREITFGRFPALARKLNADACETKELIKAVAIIEYNKKNLSKGKNYDFQIMVVFKYQF